MLSLENKIKILKEYLVKVEDNYSDSFKPDLYYYFDNFTIQNKKLFFLNKIHSENEIIEWIDNVLSNIVLKYDEEFEQLPDFLDYFVFVETKEII